MTPEQIAELEALAEKATPGPWMSNERGAYSDFGGESNVIASADPDDLRRIAAVHNEVNATLIVALVNNLPAILAALKAQQPREDVVERVATVLAPFVCRPVHNGDCDDIAAGQSHARYVARAAIAAMQENPDEG